MTAPAGLARGGVIPTRHIQTPERALALVHDLIRCLTEIDTFQPGVNADLYRAADNITTVLDEDILPTLAKLDANEIAHRQERAWAAERAWQRAETTMVRA